MNRRSTAYARVASEQVRARSEALGAATLVTGVDVRTPLRLRPDELVRLGRHLADQCCDHVEAWVDGGLNAVLPGADLRRVLAARLTLRFVLKDLPPLLGTLSAATGPTVVLDSGLSDEQLHAVAEAVGGSTSVTGASSNLALDLLPPAGRARRRLMRAPGGGGGVVLVCGSVTDLPFLLPSLDAAGARPVTVLLKNGRPEAMRAGAVLGARGAELLPVDGLPGWSATTAGREARARLAAAAGAAAGRDPLLRELDRALDLVCRVESVLRARQPRAVVGALDRSPVGGALAGAPSRADVSVVDVQHGTFLPAGVLDLLAFDVVLAWNARTAERLRADGHAGGLKVVGNPRWDELAELTVEPTAAAQRLRSWKGSRRLVLYLPQPAKGPYLTAEVLSRTEGVLAELLRDRSETCLLVKERARASGAGDHGPLSGLAAEDRVRVVADDELELAQALALANVGVSIYSTALADALAAGVPAVAVDVAGVVRDLRLDFFDVVPVCSSAVELGLLLDRAWDAGPPAQAPEVFPSFPLPYAERLVAALAPVLAVAGPPRTGSSRSSRAMRALAGSCRSRWPFADR